MRREREGEGSNKGWLSLGSTKTLLKYVASINNLILDEVVVKFPLKDTKEVKHHY